MVANNRIDYLYMRLYTLAHAAYFEACIAGHPRAFCDWLAEQIPPMPDYRKDSLEWLMLRSRAMPDILPDYCYGCKMRHGELPGGNVRLVCPNCVKDDKPEADSEMSWFTEMQVTLINSNPHAYFPELLEYLLAVHALWIATEKYKLGEITWKQQESKPSPRDRLLEKIRAQSYASKRS